MGNESSTPIPYDVQLEWRKREASTTASTPAPAGREGHVAVAWENKMYVFGGGSSGGAQQDDLWSLDLESFEWKEVATSGNAPSARTGACAAVVDGRMFVFGGMDMERGFLDDFYSFNIADGTWEQVQGTGEGPTPRDKSAVCVIGKKLYFFGGFGPVPEPSGQGSEGDDDDDDDEEEEDEDEGPAMNFNWFDDLFVYDTENNSWQQVATNGQVPTPRAAFGMDVVDSFIYLFGGRDTTKRQNDLFSLDTRTNIWATYRASGSVPTERSFHTLTSLVPAGKQQLVAFGGLSATNILLDDIHIYDIATQGWVQPTIATSAGRINARRFHSAVLHNRSLVVFGGSSSFSPETQECLTFHNDTFTLDLSPVLDAAPVTIPPPPATAPATSTDGKASTPDEGASTVRGKKRKSDEIEDKTALSPTSEKDDDGDGDGGLDA